jgi:DNA-binding transcriptional LysR family regulator
MKIVLHFLCLFPMVSFACDVVPAPLVRPDPKEFVIQGRVMATVGPLSSPKFKFSGAVWGLKVVVEEVNYPCSSLAIYALVPAKRLMPKKARLFLDELDRHIKQTA